MSPGSDLEPVAETLDDVFSRMGLPHPQLMAELMSKWDELAGEPWVGRSKPLVIRGKTLVVEAAQPSIVAFLRYGSSTLTQTLQERFGEGSIDGIEVVAPKRL